MKLERCKACGRVKGVIHTVRLGNLKDDIRRSVRQKTPKMVQNCRASSKFGLCKECYLKSKKEKGETNCDVPENSCEKYDKSTGNCLYLVDKEK